ncbi:probable transport accessory protein MmpS3 isoform X2 [Ruditapes philippinarum]|uniref:probable transport accessory protein MmpS3 isoform X2 n=1 Tax=Ruditapes philippinarum TaxID=129788 RepID=UPI00295AD862|nr:probable transport accessory protein MmpS3 isoform X2 [Ruditapes philippinarum]
MNAQTTFKVVNPMRLCALVVLIISAPKVLTETTTDITSTTYTVTTPADVASQKPTTQKPATVPPSSGPLSSTVKVPVTKPNTGTTKGSVPVPKPSTKAASQTTIKITTKKPTPVPTTKKSIPVTTKKPGNEGQFEPLSEPSDTGSTVGSVVGAIVGVAAVIVALILFWKLGVLKKCKEFPCKRSKVGTYDVENGEVTKNGTKPLDAQKGTKPPDAQNGTKLAEKTLKTL